MTVTRESLATILRSAYAATSDQDLKDQIGMFLIQEYPDTVTDAQIFNYWQALGRDAEDVNKHFWALRAIRVRWPGATAQQKQAVQNELDDILNDTNAAQELKDSIQSLIDEVINPPPAFDPETEFGSVNAGNLDLSTLAEIKQHWHDLPVEAS